MEVIKLNKGYTFVMEESGKNLRLIVFNDGVEKVCRKFPQKKLLSFLQSGDNHLFRGRLQLFKDEVGINIDVKGEVVGKISADNFKNYVNSVIQQD